MPLCYAYSLRLCIMHIAYAFEYIYLSIYYLCIYLSTCRYTQVKLPQMPLRTYV